MDLRERLNAVVTRLQEIRDELAETDTVLARTLDEDADDETRTAHDTAVKAAEDEAAKLIAEGDQLAAERKSLEERIEKRDRIAEAAKDLPTISGDGPRVHTERVGDPYRPELVQRAFRPDGERELRDAALKAVEMVEDWELDGTDDAAQRAQLAKRARRNPHICRLLIATGSEHYKRAFEKAAMGHHFLFTPEERDAVQRAMSLTNAAGGFAVPFPIDPTLIVTGDGSTNPVRSRCRVVDIDTDSWQGIAAGPITASWDGEAAEVGDDTPTWTQPQVTPYKAHAFVPFSIEIGMDYPNLVGDLRELFGQGKDDLEAVAFITGTGSNQPTGLVTAIDGTGNDITSATTDVFAAADVDSVHETLGPKYRNRANTVWFANIAIINDIRAFGTTDNRFTVDLSAEGVRSLYGRDILEASAMDGTITALADNNVLLFGDPSTYLIADRAGFNLELVPHMFATGNNRPSGQRGWYGWWRTGGDSINDDGWVLLNVT